MKFYDQHVHTTFSPDGNSTIDEYLHEYSVLGYDYIVFTDHCDFLSEKDKLDEIFLEREKYISEKRKEYPNIQILSGVEMGYEHRFRKQIDMLLSKFNFSSVILSTHFTSNIDYYLTEPFEKLGVDKTLKLYFREELKSITEFDNFDIFGHIDYGYKTALFLDSKLKISDYEKYLIKIMKKIIEKDKVLEINTKVQESIGNDEHTLYLLNLYKSLGGKNITLSSDCHEIQRINSSFEKYSKLIKKGGFDHLCYFKNRKRFEYKI